MKPLGRREALAARREYLVARSARERLQLAGEFAPLRQLASRIDLRLTAARSLAANPVVIGVAIGAVAFVGPRRLLAIARRSAGLWMLWRNWAPLAARFLARRLG